MMKRTALLIATLFLAGLPACDLMKLEKLVEEGAAELTAFRSTWDSAEFNCAGTAGTFSAKLRRAESGDYRLELKPITLTQAGAIYTLSLTDDAYEGFALTMRGLRTDLVANIDPVRAVSLAELPFLVIQRAEFFDRELRAPTTTCRLPEVPSTRPIVPVMGSLRLAATFSYDRPLQARALLTQGSRLFVSGFPFGMLTLDIFNPAQPNQIFAAADNIAEFAPLGAWTIDHYASRGLLALRDYLLSVGTTGVSAMRIENDGDLEVVAQTPPTTAYSLAGLGQAWKEDHFLGFGTTGFIDEWVVDSTSVEPSGMLGMGIPGMTVSETASFGRRTLLRTANNTRVVVARPDSFTPPREGVASSGPLAAAGDHWYLHTATGANGSPGYVAYDHNYRAVAMFPGSVPLRFTVSEDGRWFFVNRNDTVIEIYEATWP